MRILAALTIYVSLAISSRAADWADVHKQGVRATERRDFANADTLLRQSWALAHTPTEHAISANDLGVTLHAINRDADAALWLDRALNLWSQDASSLNRRAQTAHSLAAVYRTTGNYSASENVLRDALALNPPDSESQAMLLNELGDLMRETGRTDEAQAAFTKASHLSGASWRSQYDTLAGNAELDREARLWGSSAARWTQALEIARAQHWDVMEAVAIRGMGDTFLDQGDTARAEPLLRKALAFFEGDRTGSHQFSATLRSLGQLYLASDKLALADELLQRALAADEQALGGNHPQVAMLLEMLGETAARRGHLSDSRRYYDRAREIMTVAFGEQSPIVAGVRASWGIIEQRAGQSAAAVADFRSALAVLNTAAVDVQPLRLSVLQHYADTLETMHMKRDAHAVRSQMKTAFAASATSR